MDIKEIPIITAIKRILKNVVYVFIARISPNMVVSLPVSNHIVKSIIIKTPKDVNLPRESLFFEDLKRSMLKTKKAKLVISNSGESSIKLSVFTIS